MYRSIEYTNCDIEIHWRCDNVFDAMDIPTASNTLWKH